MNQTESSIEKDDEADDDDDEMLLGLSVKCYVGVEPAGERYKLCDLSRGLRTCYIKYDMCKLDILSGGLYILPFLHSLLSVGEVVARGCSSKEKMFHQQCEVHEMDDIMEKFCYCSFNWCNSSPYLRVRHRDDSKFLVIFSILVHKNRNSMLSNFVSCEQYLLVHYFSATNH